MCGMKRDCGGVVGILGVFYVVVKLVCYFFIGILVW